MAYAFGWKSNNPIIIIQIISTEVLSKFWLLADFYQVEFPFLPMPHVASTHVNITSGFFKEKQL